ncbi:MAG TPA: hypothetical protein VIV12_02250 [Streptosporangiaceae bacterium]
MRMVIGLDPTADRESVELAVRAAGATGLRPQSPSLPDVIVADFPDNDEAALIARLGTIDGIRYVERDAMRGFS